MAALDHMRSLLAVHFQKWFEDHNYLGLDDRHYDLSLPPMLFMGGGAIPCDATPLVIISIEPLIADHFESQRSFATCGFAQYTDLNLRLFDKLPELAGTRAPQPYFANLYDFVSGWARDSGTERTDPWPLFAQNIIELPYVPMHAPKWDARATHSAAERLTELFKARLELVMTAWPAAGFTVLGAAVGDELTKSGVLSVPIPVDLPPPSAPRSMYGTRYFDVGLQARWITGTRRLVFGRRGPFSNGHNPTAFGRRDLGRLLRASHDSTFIGSLSKPTGN